ncbi:hypothetical protein B0H17DRAFT_960054 [Mycena rosella]|uniref:CxC2-like cysteine cluster KDZ transposase-associated domain-containing protein n=1 Tax=Mycena rosella TaxID=1033263 RepID=A0AAD7C9I9_MYCRO|nr:hypothetical protein B0H17DRAFT_960054 [Mycena rosella]
MIAAPLQIGHSGNRCEALPKDAIGRPFTITHTNGVHRTLVHFCAHTGGNGVKPLMRAELFPATFDKPMTAYTFQVLKNFELHNLESKQSAYDYCGSLMRLTDNAFPAENVTPGFNMDKNMTRQLPEELRHLNQERLTLDGNFHCNKAKKTSKNSDPNDTSLYIGKAHFPEQAAQKAYLARAPKSQEARNNVLQQKSTCNYLKAVNNQDKEKFKNMEVTGVVNTQCSHVFVRASVDLEFGERFVNVDAALAHALRQKMATGATGEFKLQLEVDVASVDRVTSYDIACQYSVKVVERFERSFPDLVPIIKKMRWAVPALHVQGHEAGCLYAYSTAYMLATGHSHGETAEQYWPELNQLGPKIRQMNYGHRQDEIIKHHNDWNHKKMCKIGT